MNICQTALKIAKVSSKFCQLQNNSSQNCQIWSHYWARIYATFDFRLSDWLKILSSQSECSKLGKAYIYAGIFMGQGSGLVPIRMGMSLWQNCSKGNKILQLEILNVNNNQKSMAIICLPLVFNQRSHFSQLQLWRPSPIAFKAVPQVDLPTQRPRLFSLAPPLHIQQKQLIFDSLKDRQSQIKRKSD